MRLVILSFVAGILWVQQQASLVDVADYVAGYPAAVTVLAGSLWLARHRHTGVAVIGTAISLIAAAALGIAFAVSIATLRLADELPHAWEGRDVEVIGAVSGLPTYTDRGLRFQFDIEHSATPQAQLPAHVSVTWYHETERKTGTVSPAPALQPGERWQLTLRLRRPHGSVNPHGFDAELWALERNLRAMGYVRARADNRRLAESAAGVGYAIDAWRANIRSRFAAALDGQPYRGVLVALAVGDQNAIPREQWKVFWRTGVGHLMSISGLHITMVASLAYLLAFAGWSRLPGLALRLPAQKAAALAGLLMALTYALVAGFSVPTQRTLYMIGVVALALFAGRISSPSRVLCWALLAVVLLDPWAVMAPGFWLSFGAIAVIFYVTAGRTGEVGALRGAVITQVAVTVGMLPMLLALFQEVSVVSPLANAFAIPVISLVVVPLTLVGAVIPWDGLLHLAHQVLVWCMVPLEWLAELPGAMWESHAPPLWAVLLALLGGAWLLAPRGWPGRWLGGIWMLPMFLVVPPGPGPGEAWLTVLDVGHGLAAVVRTANHALVYDTGPKWSEDADSGSRIVVPHLRGEGIRRLNGLIVSHDDEDHTGGAISILDARDVGWVASSLPATSPILTHTPDSRPCQAGQTWTWDGVRFDVLHPSVDSYADAALKDNDRSCVVRIVAHGKSVLLTADIEKRAEAALLARAPADLRADVLLIPHHGSKTSSTPAFIAAVAPEWAILPVGYRNRFRHPHPDVMARYDAARVKVLRTDWGGAIHLRLTPAGIQTESERTRRNRYWRDQPATEAATE